MITNWNSDTHRGGRRVAALCLAVLAVALTAAACSTGSGASGAAATAPATAPATAAATAPASAPVPPATGGAISAQASSLGVILVDGTGRTVYEFANDTNGTSACTGSCATNWPFVPAPAPLPTSLSGVTGQLGTITRQDGGVQLTIAGHPLYTFAGDSAPGQTNGEGKTLDGGLWAVASVAGAPVTAANPAAAPTSAPAVPGY